MSITLEQICDDQLMRYAALIYDRTGISISPQKKTLLSNRLRRRLRATGIVDFESYFDHLKGLHSEDPEWDAFLQEITTHETYLFRDESQWNWFREEFIPEQVSLARAGKRAKSLRIWSAACSTGDEAYTIASSLAAYLPNCSQWDIQIFGSDIGVGAVEEARSAVFGERAMRLVPEDLCRRFFVRLEDGKSCEAKPTLTAWTRFQQHNLLEPLKEPPFDLIFLKNVLIYFDVASKTKVLRHIRRALRPGGLLLTAAAEGVADLVGDLEKIKPWLHRMPEIALRSSNKNGDKR